MTTGRITLQSDHVILEKAFKIALDNFQSNIKPWKSELIETPVECIIAGKNYDRPWTRDAALNSWYAGSLLKPDIAKQTLLAVLTEDEFGLRIGGQYWDAIIWVSGAWNHYLCTGDKVFLRQAYVATENSLRYFEQTEFDETDNLFRGAACYKDGVSGYPDKFTDGPTSGIYEWVDNHPNSKSKPGHGLPMKALSTNCLYYNAYKTISMMEAALGTTVQKLWKQKASNLKAAINTSFWSEEKGHYRYLVDGMDTQERQEGFGHAFAILFDIADSDKTQSILNTQYITPNGIACLWPNFERYENISEESFGRHSGTIWPQVNTAWVVAAVKSGAIKLALSELTSLSTKAVRDGEFVEIYHPKSGLPYGGVQERFTGGGEIIEWDIRHKQTWCATGYIQMVLSVLIGLSVHEDSLTFNPHLPNDITYVELEGLIYRNTPLKIRVESGHGKTQYFLNGQEQIRPCLTRETKSRQDIKILLP